MTWPRRKRWRPPPRPAIGIKYDEARRVVQTVEEIEADQAGVAPAGVSMNAVAGVRHEQRTQDQKVQRVAP